MLAFSSASSSSSLSRAPPQRSDSLLKHSTSSSSLSAVSTSLSPKENEKYFRGIEDDLHDVRRVHSQGQEEDLRYALDRMMSRVTELVSHLKDAHKAQLERETSLNLARSNLQLMMSNNEMLEEALARTSTSTKDVGWRRWSAKEGSERERVRGSEDRPRSLDLQGDAASPAPSPKLSPVSPAVATPTSAASQDSRFFRFRFSSASSAASSANGRGSTTPTPTVNTSPTRSPIPPHAHVQGAHLTSNSMPSLINPRDQERERELEELEKKRVELAAQLAQEREAREKAHRDKEAMEAELESLSQALFEEANKMVADERIRRAETEEELKEARKEQEALKSALRIIEGENGRLRLTSRTHHSRTSSEIAIKSPPRSPSPQNEPTPTSADQPTQDPDPSTKKVRPSAIPLPSSRPPSPPLSSLSPPSSITPTSAVPNPMPRFTPITPETETTFSPEFPEHRPYGDGTQKTPYLPDEPSPWA